METVRFGAKGKSEFAAALRKNVNRYFKDKGISTKADYRFALKIPAMLALYLGPFILLFCIDMPGWAQLLMTFAMGFGLAGVGMSVMHDSTHGSVSNREWVNKMLSGSMYLLGGNVFTWKLQHNVLHHTFTNIMGLDDDIRERSTIRLSPHAPLKKYHKYQHLYAMPLYCLMTLSIVLRDFEQLHTYNRKGLTERQKGNPRREYTIMLITKLLYFGVMLFLPFFFFAWWKVLIGFFVVHFTGGLIMAMVFQLAHVVEGAEHPEPNEEGMMDNDWAIHQLETTANFAHNSRIMAWYIGGLNYQIEHHLFPHISHVHYPAISEIVQQTAYEHGLAYNTKPTFMHAVVSHLRMLKVLGRMPEVQPAM